MDSRIISFLLLVSGVILSITGLYPGAFSYIYAIIGFILIIIALVGLWKGKASGLGNKEYNH
jgi:uncharacterized membrane protein